MKDEEATCASQSTFVSMESSKKQQQPEYCNQSYEKKMRL
jgi:hypothetical protein